MITERIEESAEDAVIRLRARVSEIAAKSQDDGRVYQKVINELRADALEMESIKSELENSRKSLNAMTAERGKWLRKLKRAGVKV